MSVVSRRIELAARVAARTQRVAGGVQLQRVRVVAIAAGHALAVHPALEERAVHVDLVEDLAVVVVEPLVEEGHPVRLGQRIAVGVVLGHLRTARVAATS